MPILMKYNGSDYKQTTLLNKHIFVFCGIAAPQSFIYSAKKLSLQIKDSCFFNDHQEYTESILQGLSEQIRANSINHVVTTEKDMVKLPNSFLSEFEIYVIRISIEFENSSDLIRQIQSTTIK